MQTIEIHAAWEIFRIPFLCICSRRFLFIHQRCHFAAQDVIHFQGRMAIRRYRKCDCRRWIKCVGKVLIKDKTRRQVGRECLAVDSENLPLLYDMLLFGSPLASESNFRL